MFTPNEDVVVSRANDNSVEIVSEEPAPTIITLSPVCNQWQKAKSAQLGLEFVRPNKINHSHKPLTVAAKQEPKTLRTKPDGNCLFRATSTVITGVQENHEILRTLTISYMLENKDLFAGVCQDIPRHILESKMASLGTWGTEVEIFAMASLLNTTFYIYGCHGHTDCWIPYKPLTKEGTEHKNEMVLLKNQHQHFEPAII